jgi:hypothetical protein
MNYDRTVSIETAKPEDVQSDAQQERILAAVAETPGMSEQVAKTAYTEVLQELALTNQTATDTELSQLVIHKVGFYQVKMLLEAMEVADEIGQGDALVDGIKHVGGRIIMDAMAGNQAAENLVQEEFAHQDGLAGFGNLVCNFEETYLAGYAQRLEAFGEVDSRQHFVAIMDRVRQLLATLKRRSGELALIPETAAAVYVAFLEGMLAKADSLGIRALSSGERSILAQAATL